MAHVSHVARPALTGPALTNSREHVVLVADFAELVNVADLFSDLVGQNFCEICGAIAEKTSNLQTLGIDFTKFCKFAKFTEFCGNFEVCGFVADFVGQDFCQSTVF